MEIQLPGRVKKLIWFKLFIDTTTGEKKSVRSLIKEYLQNIPAEFPLQVLGSICLMGGSFFLIRRKEYFFLFFFLIKKKITTMENIKVS